MRSPLNDALNRKWSEASATLEKLERELAAERERADRAKAEGIKEGMRMAAEKLVAGKKPCDCIKPVGPEGALVPYDCYCGNHGDIADAAAWCAVENAKAAILKEAGE